MAEPRDKLTGYVPPQTAPPGASSFRVNLVAAAKEGRGGYYLEDGDVVMVEKRDPLPIHVIGLVRKPGQYDLPTHREVRVLDALALAGGLDIPWADNILVIRQAAGQAEPILIKVSLREAKQSGETNVRLAPGDVVSVEQTPATVVYDVIRKFNLGIGGTAF
jgi:polysaccharide export outer membrane protein